MGDGLKRAVAAARATQKKKGAAPADPRLEWGDVFLADGAWHLVREGGLRPAWCGKPSDVYEKAISHRVFERELAVPLSGRCRVCFADDWRRGYLS